MAQDRPRRSLSARIAEHSPRAAAETVTRRPSFHEILLRVIGARAGPGFVHTRPIPMSSVTKGHVFGRPPATASIADVLRDVVLARAGPGAYHP
eukprot:CAMPEP_0117622562 /NCGR_PEP_ID=MMETSP0784-20121206/88203_1 /TAXON_ID=39447 /ORGANISM="" /LENGTH=93 /DNA_ID=CAMNT_0005426501 /DNA_START=446 /DNA_END=723 /DNA_ORIENTATION=+